MPRLRWMFCHLCATARSFKTISTRPRSNVHRHLAPVRFLA
jgi:hypothetical protein